MVRPMKASRSQSALPLSVQRAMRKLGADISTARRRRNMTVELMAERAFVGRNTITRVERGDPGVSLGIYATVLFVLGMADRLTDLADPASDAVGLNLEAGRLPQRARPSRKTPS
jgi:transcriptional regulator with XRE-family HTH domain